MGHCFLANCNYIYVYMFAHKHSLSWHKRKFSLCVYRTEPSTKDYPQKSNRYAAKIKMKTTTLYISLSLSRSFSLSFFYRTEIKQKKQIFRDQSHYKKKFTTFILDCLELFSLKSFKILFFLWLFFFYLSFSFFSLSRCCWSIDFYWFATVVDAIVTRKTLVSCFSISIHSIFLATRKTNRVKCFPILITFANCL